jgi:hypothetical protein
MLQGRHRACFIQQGLIALRVGRAKVQGLDGHFTLQMRVMREIHHALDASPQLAHNLEASYFFPFAPLFNLFRKIP